LTENIARMRKMRIAHRILIEVLEVQKPFEAPTHRSKDNIQIDCNTCDINLCV